jgi:trans-aconitate methyltransferase
MKIIPMLVAFLEKKVAGNRTLMSFYANYYHQVIDNEIKLASITAKDRVLNIGCGAIPFTALLTARKTGARVWAIDCDKTAVKVAQRCVVAQQLEHLVTVMHLDGTENIPIDFDVAIVALQAKPKKAILDNLLKSGSAQARLVFRRPRSDMAHQYDLLPARPLFSDFIGQDKATFDGSVLYAN